MAEYTLLFIKLGVHAVVISTTEVALQILKKCIQCRRKFRFAIC